MQRTKTVELNDTQMRRWMGILLERAKRVGEEGEVPVTAVVLNEKGYCIGHGRNARNSDCNPMGHAELIALRQAAWLKDDWRFNECTLIVTLEPCQMCAGALIQARMGKVVFGAVDSKRGGLGGAIDLSTHKSAHHKMLIESGIMKEQVTTEITRWFKERRKIKTKI